MSTPPVQAVPDNMRGFIPHLTCTGAAQAIAWYQRAFGAVELARIPGPDGRLIHAMIEIDGHKLMLVDEFPEMGGKSPKTLGGSAVTLHRFVPDVDAAYAQALAAGATVLMPLADMFWGDRYGCVTDPFGHHWSLATHQKNLTAEQIGQAMQSAG